MARSRLKEVRMKAGMTQQQVAEKLGISLRQYIRVEKGESIGRIELWDALEDMFKVNQRELRQLVREDNQ